MYRKRMSEALQEARAYRDPVNEDRGFSSQQIKMAYGVLNDPRYKQGNYSGAVRAIEKIAKGLSNHPDVANALRRANEELEEALEVKWDSNKQGWFDKQGRRRYLGKMATNKLMSKAIDKAKETGDFINPFKLQHGQKPEETELEEGYEGNIIAHLGELGIDAKFKFRKLLIKRKDMARAKDALKDGIRDRNSIISGHKMPDIKTFGEELEEGKYERYSNLLIQKGRMQKANDKQGERLTDIEIEKEKKKLGIRDEYIPEGMVKRVMQTVHDKLSKEGGAAGFDDLAKEVKKEFGITISKDTLKNMPGVKQHRDGDYILENKSSELINLYQIKNKTPEIEARIAKLEKELKVIKREETELEENFQNFTKADFAKLEADNEHGEAAEKLVQKFGTKEERNIIAVINIRHHKTGYISGPDFRERTRIVNKYYSRLK